MPALCLRLRWGQIIALELAAFLALILLTLLGGQSVSRAESGLDGGFVGWGLAELLRSILAKFALQHIFWSYLLVLLGLFVCLFFGLGLAAPLRRLLRRCGTLFKINVFYRHNFTHRNL